LGMPSTTKAATAINAVRTARAQPIRFLDDGGPEPPPG
jgi:hypothetical protein